jgi:hypothetical protein
MTTPGMRVIFDRSAFHGDRFDALARSPLRILAARGRVRSFLTPVFIDETISAYGSARAPDDWRDHLKFAVDVCNGGLMLTRDNIWHNELVKRQGRRARHIFPEIPTKRYGKSNREWLETLRALTSKSHKDLADAWMGSEAERAETNRRKDAQRALFSRIRSDVAAGQRVRKLGDISFQRYLANEFLAAGKQFMSLVDNQRRVELGELWAVRPDRYPFFSAFIEGALYSAFYAMIEQRERLDRNAQSDWEQLSYLVWADIMVSNEERFLRKAFDALWKPRGKQLMTAEEFSDHLSSLVQPVPSASSWFP